MTNYPPHLIDSVFMCCFCENAMTEEQTICCDTYKGKMTIEDFLQYYGKFMY